jgi:hypothetical protein
MNKLVTARLAAALVFFLVLQVGSSAGQANKQSGPPPAPEHLPPPLPGRGLADPEESYNCGVAVGPAPTKTQIHKLTIRVPFTPTREDGTRGKRVLVNIEIEAEDREQALEAADDIVDRLRVQPQVDDLTEQIDQYIAYKLRSLHVPVPEPAADDEEPDAHTRIVKHSDSAKKQAPRGNAPAEAPCLNRTQIRFVSPSGMKVSWLEESSDGKASNSENAIDTPGRYTFRRGAIYRLKLSNIGSQPGFDFYPTLEVMRSSARSEAYLAHNAVAVNFTNDDFRQVTSGDYLVKVIYLETPQDEGPPSPFEIASWQYAPGTDLIKEAQSRGDVLLVIRMGNEENGPLQVDDTSTGEITVDGLVQMLDQVGTYLGLPTLLNLGETPVLESPNKDTEYVPEIEVPGPETGFLHYEQSEVKRRIVEENQRSSWQQQWRKLWSCQPSFCLPFSHELSFLWHVPSHALCNAAISSLSSRSWDWEGSIAGGSPGTFVGSGCVSVEAKPIEAAACSLVSTVQALIECHRLNHDQLIKGTRWGDEWQPDTLDASNSGSSMEWPEFPSWKPEWLKKLFLVAPDREFRISISFVF